MTIGHSVISTRTHFRNVQLIRTRRDRQCELKISLQTHTHTYSYTDMQFTHSHLHRNTTTPTQQIILHRWIVRWTRGFKYFPTLVYLPIYGEGRDDGYITVLRGISCCVCLTMSMIVCIPLCDGGDYLGDKRTACPGICLLRPQLDFGSMWLSECLHVSMCLSMWLCVCMSVEEDSVFSLRYFYYIVCG